jgi:hypothetical protein
LGLPDPRFGRFSSTLDFRLKRQLAGYQRLDPPPQRVKPIPLPVLRFAVDATSRRLSPLAEALSDLIVLAFFYLLRPGSMPTLLLQKPPRFVYKMSISSVVP